MHTRHVALWLVGVAASADAFAGAPMSGLQLRSARAMTGTPVSMKASAGDTLKLRKHMAAVLASAVLASPLTHVQPAFAAGEMAAEAPAVEKKETSTNGVQNWRCGPNPRLVDCLCSASQSDTCACAGTRSL
jgi:hypothetical protein